MSDSHRSPLVIKAHLPIDQAGRRYRSDCKKFRIKKQNGSSRGAVDVTIDLDIKEKANF